MRRTVLVLAVLMIAFAPAPLPKPKRGSPSEPDLNALQGTWETVSLECNGMKLQKKPGSEMTIFAGRLVSCVVEGKVITEWNLLLDPTEIPKVLDLRDKQGRLVRGIYRLDGDTLTLCYVNELDGKRPAEFRAGKGVGLEVLRRGRR
jgi:RNA polymerase sigma-70 factor (ECF subfamily)